MHKYTHYGTVGNEKLKQSITYLLRGTNKHWITDKSHAFSRKTGHSAGPCGGGASYWYLDLESIKEVEND